MRPIPFVCPGPSAPSFLPSFLQFGRFVPGSISIPFHSIPFDPFGAGGRNAPLSAAIQRSSSVSRISTASRRPVCSPLRGSLGQPGLRWNLPRALRTESPRACPDAPPRPQEEIEMMGPGWNEGRRGGPGYDHQAVRRLEGKRSQITIDADAAAVVAWTHAAIFSKPAPPTGPPGRLDRAGRRAWSLPWRHAEFELGRPLPENRGQPIPAPPSSACFASRNNHVPLAKLIAFDRRGRRRVCPVRVGISRSRGRGLTGSRHLGRGCDPRRGRPEAGRDARGRRATQRGVLNKLTLVESRDHEPTARGAAIDDAISVWRLLAFEPLSPGLVEKLCLEALGSSSRAGRTQALPLCPPLPRDAGTRPDQPGWIARPSRPEDWQDADRARRLRRCRPLRSPTLRQQTKLAVLADSPTWAPWAQSLSTVSIGPMIDKSMFQVRHAPRGAARRHRHRHRRPDHRSGSNVGLGEISSCVPRGTGYSIAGRVDGVPWTPRPCWCRWVTPVACTWAARWRPDRPRRCPNRAPIAQPGFSTPSARPLDDLGRLAAAGSYRTYATAVRRIVAPAHPEALPTGDADVRHFVPLKGAASVWACSPVPAWAESTLLGMIAPRLQRRRGRRGPRRWRGREVRFIEKDLGPGSAQSRWSRGSRSTLRPVAAARGLHRHLDRRAYPRRRQERLLASGSVTRTAMAQREIGLASANRRPPADYTPSVFAMLPRLLERTGARREGSIGHLRCSSKATTRNEPVADAVRGILDGHLVLSRQLAPSTLSGHRRARAWAVSRATSAPGDSPARRLPEHLAVSAARADLVVIGAYQRAPARRIDRAGSP